LKKRNKAKQAVKIISEFFSPQEMVKLSNQFFYNRLNYGATIWLFSALSASLKNKILADIIKDVKNLTKRLARTVDSFS
jgi:hypothetical protein